MANRKVGKPIDLDALGALEDERDFLLRSLDDLDAEFQAGDISQQDFKTLSDSYVQRTASVLNEIDSLQDGHAQQQAESTRSRSLVAISAVVVLAFGTIVGWVIANNVGFRSSSDTITGSIDTPAAELQRCIDLSFGEFEKSLTCFDELLATSPENAKALAYKGWAMVRSTPDGQDPVDAVAVLNQALAADPELPDTYVFLAVTQKNAGDFEAAQESLDTLYSLDPPPAVLSTMRTLGLDVDVATGLLSVPTQECWSKERVAINNFNVALSQQNQDEEALKAAVREMLAADSCFADVLAVTPDDVDALIFKALGLSVLNPSFLEDARVLLDRAIEAEPDNPNVLLMRSAISNMMGNPQQAAADLDSLGDRAVSPLLGTIDRNAIREDVESQLDDAGS